MLRKKFKTNHKIRCCSRKFIQKNSYPMIFLHFLVKEEIFFLKREIRSNLEFRVSINLRLDLFLSARNLPVFWE